MKPLIGIINAHTRPEYQQAVRDTWLRTVHKDLVDIKFFLGRGATREPKDDEVFLNVDDSYQGLPEKCQAMFAWAYEHGYQFCMKEDDDTILHTNAWLRSYFEPFDFTGNTVPGHAHPQVPYGFAYVLSRKAMEHVISATLPEGNNDEEWITRILYAKGIRLHADPRYFLHTGKKNDKVRTGPRPLRVFNRPLEREAPPNTFCWCIALNWEGFHATPTEEILKEYYAVWERTRCLL